MIAIAAHNLPYRDRCLCFSEAPNRTSYQLFLCHSRCIFVCLFVLVICTLAVCTYFTASYGMTGNPPRLLNSSILLYIFLGLNLKYILGKLCVCVCVCLAVWRLLCFRKRYGIFPLLKMFEQHLSLLGQRRATAIHFINELKIVNGVDFAQIIIWKSTYNNGFTMCISSCVF